jgi:hypothetical protein
VFGAYRFMGSASFIEDTFGQIQLHMLRGDWWSVTKASGNSEERGKGGEREKEEEEKEDPSTVAQADAAHLLQEGAGRPLLKRRTFADFGSFIYQPLLMSDGRAPLPSCVPAHGLSALPLIDHIHGRKWLTEEQRMERHGACIQSEEAQRKREERAASKLKKQAEQEAAAAAAAAGTSVAATEDDADFSLAGLE